MKKKIKNEEVKEQETVSEPTTTVSSEPVEPKKPLGHLHASGNEDFNKVVGKINEIIDYITK